MIKIAFMWRPQTAMCIVQQKQVSGRRVGGTVPDGWSINSIAVYDTQVYVVTQGGHVYTQKI